MTEYIVLADAVGVPSKNVEAAPVPIIPAPNVPEYHERGSVIEIEDEVVAQRLLDAGVIVAADDADDGHLAVVQEREDRQAQGAGVPFGSPTIPVGDIQARADAAMAEDKRRADEAQVAADREREEADAARERDEADAARARQEQENSENERLTEKQALVKEAGDRGLDTEGTISDLKERIAADKQAKGEE